MKGERFEAATAHTGERCTQFGKTGNLKRGGEMEKIIFQ